MQKRVYIILITTTILICLSACSYNKDASSSTKIPETSTMESAFEIVDTVNFTEVTEKELDIYFKLCKETVEKYYRAVSSNDPVFPLFNLSITDRVKKYLELKFRYETKSKSAKTYIDGNYKLNHWKIIGESLLCDLTADISFQYSEAPFISGMGIGIQIIIENPKKPTISDWYIGDPASFDAQVRGYYLNLSEKENWLSSQDIDKIINKGNEIVDSIK